MVARGDLGVEMPPEDVPSVQKQIIQACRVAGKPVIVATQIAGVDDWFAGADSRRGLGRGDPAVYEGADAVMLSAETAAGRYPVESVEIMDRIACRVQRDPLYHSMMESTRIEHEHTAPDAISAACVSSRSPSGRGGNRFVHDLRWRLPCAPLANAPRPRFWC